MERRRLYKYIKIVGAIGKIDRKKIDFVSKKYDIRLIPLDARFIFGSIHIESAIDCASRSFERGVNIAKDFGIEIVRYASGERQISDAIDKIWAKPKSNKIILIIIGKSNAKKILYELGLKGDNSALAADGKDIREFGITEQQIATVQNDKQIDLVLEKIALLDPEK